jgi:hypothetical protein
MNMCSEKLFDGFWLDSHSAIAGIEGDGLGGPLESYVCQV